MEGIQSTSAQNGDQATDKSVTISVPNPHTYDLGNLLLNDSNPLPHAPTPEDIAAVARTCAQSLLNQLLTTCPIHTSTTSSHEAGSVLMTLPPPTTPLPREKPLPKPKEKTTWEKFAAKKGIASSGKGGKDGTGKMVFDEEKGEWVPKWGYKGKGGGDEEWIVEVDEKKEKSKGGVNGRGGQGLGMKGKKGALDGERTLGEGRKERKENARRNERKQRANERKTRKGGGGT